MRNGTFQPTIHPDPCPELLIERGSDRKGVGTWVPFDKHRLLTHYLDASRHAWKAWGQRVFIDPFCGPGRIQVKGESFTRDGGATVAWHALSAAAAPFTKMLVGDIDVERSNACDQRLRSLGALVDAHVGPAVETIDKMVSAVPQRGALTLAYLDPYNLEFLAFPIIQALASLQRVDLAINFSTMDLQRNAEFEFDPSRARFDLTAPGWRDDPAIRACNKQNVPLAFFHYWVKLVKGLGFQYSKEMPLVRNDVGHPIYRMVFFARHDLPVRLWGDIARDKNRSLDLF